MPDDQKQLSAENCGFKFSTFKFFQEASKQGTRIRRFQGIGYSGEVIPNHFWWGNVAFDLGSMTVPERLPALIDHDSGQRAGFIDSHTINEKDGLSVSGVLLENEFGKTVADDSDQGFPWQMSVHIEPGSIEEVQAGQKVKLNGKDLQGPLTIFRNSRIREVSFCATGYDANTSAAAFSRGKQPLGDTTMDLQQLQAEVARLTAENTAMQASHKTQIDGLQTQLTAAKDQIAQFSTSKRKDEVKALFAELGLEFKEGESEAPYLPMDEKTFSIVKANMAQAKGAKQELPENLFKHQATGQGQQGQAQQQGGGKVLSMSDAAKQRKQSFMKQGSR